jgi:hypothetical protein
LIKLQREEKSASPNRVNVIGQNADRDGFEWAALLDGPIDNSQSINLVHQQPARPVGENDGEEENAAFEFRSDVSWHEQLSCTKMVGTPRRAALPTLRKC